MDSSEAGDRIRDQNRSIELLQANGVSAVVNRAIRYGTIKTPLRILPTEKIPVGNLHWIFEVRSRVLPRVSDANPLDLVWIDPSDIEYIHPPGLPRPPDRYGYVIGGEWDKNKIRFEEYFTHKSFQARYEDGADWEETELFEWRLSNIQSGQSPRGLSSRSELDSYLSGIDDLYQKISKEGYKSQQELLELSPSETRARNNDSIHPALNEICVNIGRAGEMIKRGSGHHRLSIAKILDLDEIPVVVKTRHSKWQRVRDEIQNSMTFYQLSEKAQGVIDHPDLSEIRPTDWMDAQKSQSGESARYD